MSGFRNRFSFSFLLMWLFCFGAVAQSSPVAMLFGKPVTLADISPSPQELNKIARLNSASKDMALAQFRHGKFAETILESVMNDYAKAKNIVADPELVALFEAKFKQQVDESRAQMNAQDADSEMKSLHDIAETQVKNWQIDKALYEEFGGTVIFQQSNPQLPVGAYEKLLKHYETQGKLAILNDQYGAVFWEAFEPPYNFEIAPENVDFSSPWWARSN